MILDLSLLYVYRILALIVAGMMIWAVVRRTDWREQVFALIVFVPFMLRALGVK